MTHQIKALTEIHVVYLFRSDNSHKILPKVSMMPMKIAFHHRLIHSIFKAQVIKDLCLVTPATIQKNSCHYRSGWLMN